MFIVSRIIGIGSYTAVLLGGYIAIKRMAKQELPIVLMTLTMLLSLMAYFYVPHENADLYRIDLYAKSFSKYSLPDMIRICVENKTPLASTPAALIFYGLMGDGHRIAFVTSFVSLTLIIRVLLDVQERCELSQDTMALVILGFLSLDVFMPIIATVRSYLSCVLVAYSLYWEIVERRISPWHWILYGIAAMMHSIGIILVMLRVVYFVFAEKDSLKLQIIAGAVTLLGLAAAAPLLSRMLRSSVDSMASYLSSGEAYSYIWEQLICGVHFLVCCVILLRYLRLDRTSEYPAYAKIMKLTLVLYGASFVQFAMMQRFSYFCALLFLPAVGICAEYDGDRSIIIPYKLISLALLAVTCTRGYLCSLKFW